MKNRKGKKSKRSSDSKRDPSSPWQGTAASDARRELRRVEARISERRGRLNDRFKAVVGILTELGYVENWTLTEHGTRLLSTFHELDLAISESIRAGHLDGHDPATLAGLVATFVFEPRRNVEDSPDWFPNKKTERSVHGIVACVNEVQRLESAYGLPATRDVDPGLFAATYGWASGGGLGDILGDEDLSGGDFVRSMKQVIDVLSQVAVIAPSSETRSAARKAIEMIQRGIVDAPGPIEVV